MSACRVVLATGLAWLFAAACGHKTVPPGTPAPEYENPPVPPWSPEGADAGATEAPREAGSSASGESSAVPSEALADAGPEGDGAPGDSGSPATDAAW